MDQTQVDFNELENMDREEESDEIEIQVPKKDNRLLTVEADSIPLQQKKIKIMRYKNVFPEELEIYASKLNIDYLNTLDEEQLNELLQQVKMTVGCRRGASLIPYAYFGVVEAVEKVGCKMNMKLAGLSHSLQTNKNLLGTLDELSLEYEDFAYRTPLERLALFTIQTIIYTHNANNNNENKKEIFNQEIKSDELNEYKDL